MNVIDSASGFSVITGDAGDEPLVEAARRVWAEIPSEDRSALAAIWSKAVRGGPPRAAVCRGDKRTRDGTMVYVPLEVTGEAAIAGRIAAGLAAILVSRTGERSLGHLLCAESAEELAARWGFPAGAAGGMAVAKSLAESL